jgi:hypothetical protein
MDWILLSLNVGDLCRTSEGAPARYIGGGKALYISAMCNDLSVSDARLARGNEGDFPLPTDEEVTQKALRFPD